MSRTFTNVCDRARVHLNDPTATGYPNADLLKGANDAVLILRQRRPDLFFGSYSAMASAEYAIGDPIPVPDEYFVPIVNYVVAFAEFRDDEEAMMDRAKDFFALFSSGVK